MTLPEKELLAPSSSNILSIIRLRILMTVFAISGFGLVMVYSASAVRASRGGWGGQYAYNQLLWLLIASLFLIISSIIPYRFWGKIWHVILLFVWGSLFLVLTPLGTRVNGANRWFRFAGFNIQPSEVAKAGLLIVVAYLLSKLNPLEVKFFRHVLPFFTMIGISVGLIAIEPDFGTAALLCTVLFCLLFAGGVKLWQFFLLATPAIPLAIFYGYSKFDHIKIRVNDWISGDSFHTNVSKLALGSGGVWGVGIGHGTAKLDYVPEVHTDFIFAIIGQELGLLATLALIFLFLFLIWQVIYLVKYTSDRFAGLLSLGIILLLGGQTVFNLGVVSGLLPPKGISLPFVSFGGSGLVTYYFLIGLLVSITRYSSCEVGQVNVFNKDYKLRHKFKSVFRN